MEYSKATPASSKRSSLNGHETVRSSQHTRNHQEILHGKRKAKNRDLKLNNELNIVDEDHLSMFKAALENMNINGQLQEEKVKIGKNGQIDSEKQISQGISQKTTNMMSNPTNITFQNITTTNNGGFEEKKENNTLFQKSNFHDISPKSFLDHSDRQSTEAITNRTYMSKQQFIKFEGLKLQKQQNGIKETLIEQNSTSGEVHSAEISASDSDDAMEIHDDICIEIDKKVGLRDNKLLERSFLTNINLHHDQLELKKKEIQKRLVSSMLSFDQIPLRPTLRKKIVPLNVGLSQKFLYGQNFSQILMTICQYDHETFTRFLSLNRYIKNHLEEMVCNTTRNVCFELQKTYGDYIKVQRSWIQGSDANSDGNYRVKKIVQVKLINSWHNYMASGKSLILKCNQISQMWPSLQTQYQLDIVPKAQPRTVWIHKNESNSNGFSSEDRRPYVQPVIPVCIEDSVEIALPMFDIKGQYLNYANPHEAKITFDNAVVANRPQDFKQFEQTLYEKPNLEVILNNKLCRKQNFYKRDYYAADLNRICEVEELVTEWFDLNTQRNNHESRNETLLTFGFPDLAFHDDDFTYIIDTFTTKSIQLAALQIGGTDFQVLKLYLTAVQPGQETFQLIESTVKVVEANRPCQNEVKRKGYIIDMHQKPKLEVRAKDSIVVYLQIGGELK